MVHCTWELGVVESVTRMCILLTRHFFFFNFVCKIVWQVHPSTIERDDLPKHSAMDANPDAVALLEMANRKMYSKDVRTPENVYADD